jgi:hypothetical protein
MNPMPAFVLTVFLSAATMVCQAQDSSGTPHLQKQGSATQLIVDGKPFLALAGELGNNSATSLENMEPVWPKLLSGNLNTALVGISWAQFEPEEGKFNYTVVDGLIAKAREKNQLEERHIELCADLGQEGLSPVSAHSDRQRQHRLHLGPGRVAEHPWRRHPRCGRRGLRRADAAH